MQNHKVPGKFLFSLEGFLKSSQIRSFCSHLSARRKKLKSAQENENEDEEATEESFAQEAEDLVEVVRSKINSHKEQSSSTSIKRAITNFNLSEPRCSSFRSKK